MKISIITVTYNAEKTISTCVDSLLRQTVPYEHIVVDGLSKDSTLGIIKTHSPSSRILSEGDQGIYDALNKGIRFATGDVIGILHADDYYPTSDILERVMSTFDDPSVEACYGDLVYVAERRESRNVKSVRSISTSRSTIQKPYAFAPQNFRVIRYWRSGQFDLSRFFWGWMPPHPTFFVRRSVYERYGLFNLELGTASDYELMLRFLLKYGVNTKYIPEILVNMRVGGVSNSSLANRLRANRMDLMAWEVNGIQPYPWTLLMKPLRKITQWWRKPQGRKYG